MTTLVITPHTVRAPTSPAGHVLVCGYVSVAFVAWYQDQARATTLANRTRSRERSRQPPKATRPTTMAIQTVKQIETMITNKSSSSSQTSIEPALSDVGCGMGRGVLPNGLMRKIR